MSHSTGWGFRLRSADAPIAAARDRRAANPDDSQNFPASSARFRHATCAGRSARCRPDRATSLFLLTLIDRTQEMMTERNLRRELVSDSLTGLPNRAGFEELVEQRGGAVGVGTDHAIWLDLARFTGSTNISAPMAGDS